MSAPPSSAETSAALEENGTPASAPSTDETDRAERRRFVLSERWRTFLGRWGVGLGGLAAALIISLRTHAFFLFPYATPVSNDEGYLAGMALRMVHGHWLPYVDGVSQRGPILYWITTAFFRLGGLWSWVPLRVLGMVLAVLITTLTFALTAVLFSPMAGGIASLALTYFLTYELVPWDGVGVNGEPVAVVFALAAALIVARLQRFDSPHRTRALFWAGFLVACGGLSKQMFLIHLVPMAVWVALGRPGTPAPMRTRMRELGFIGLGFAVPYVFVVGLYTATGHLGTFVYYYQRYGRDIFMDPLTRDFIRDKLREQIDRYFIGIAGIGGIWFFAIARALRQTLAPRSETAPKNSYRDAQEPSDAAIEDGSPVRPPLAPESHAMLNFVVPGLGLGMLPRAQWLGALAALGTLATIGARFALRRLHDIPYTSVGMLRDFGIWMAYGFAAAVVSAWLIRQRHPTVQWDGIARLRDSAAPWYGVLHMTCAFVGACFTFRFFPHYFVQFFPFAAVVIGGVVGSQFDTLEADDRPGLASALTLMIGGIFLLVIANSALARNVRVRRETDRWYQDPIADPVVRYVLERTTPDQTIFVWGFRAETYLSARRYPGSRYVYTVYPAGVVPWFQATHEEEERRVVPGSREQLLEDLEHDQPELVIDAGRSMNGRYMYNYPVLRTYLDRKYCFMRYVDGEPVYRRRHAERCPPADY